MKAMTKADKVREVLKDADKPYVIPKVLAECQRRFGRLADIRDSDVRQTINYDRRKGGAAAIPAKRSDSKAAKIRSLLPGFTKPYDYKKILAAAIARFGPGFSEQDVKQAINRPVGSRSKFGLNGRTAAPVPQAAAPQPPKAPPTADSYAVTELQAARVLLLLCGGSLFRATNVVKLMSDLTNSPAKED